MRQITLRVVITLLTFTVGVTCAVVYIAEQLVQERATHVREVALRGTLRQMREAIGKYSADRNALPRSLSDLIEAKLIDDVPIDPITENRNWQIAIGTNLNGSKVTHGIVDVHSASSARSSENTLYSEW